MGELGFTAQEEGPFDSIEHAIVDADGNLMGVGRPKGLHLSEIIKYIRVLRKDKTLPLGWQNGATLYFGFMWEYALELAFKALGLYMYRESSVEKQIRVTYDKVHMTIDGVDYSEDPPLLEEYKATWRSTRWLDREGYSLEQNFEENFPDWIYQVQGYLKGLQTHTGKPMRCVRLYVFFVMSDWCKKCKPGPRVRVFRLCFAQQKIDNTWRMLRTVGDRIEEERNAEQAGGVA